jgi:long-subunit fatty acid transport protein
VTEKGRYNEWLLSFGGNYMEKLLLGGTIGIPDVRYERSSIISESTDADNTFDFRNFSYREDLLTKGWGVNLKLGFIYKATDAFRFGAAIHTPTWLMLNDQYSYGINSNSQGQTISAYTDPGIYTYQLTTPWRGVISATGIIGKYGFVSADYEYVGYNTARFSFNMEDQELESFTNRQIRSTYKGASNFRLGAEARPAEFISLRLGFGYYGSPYKSSAVNGDRIDISAGLGFRFSNWFADFGFVNSSVKNTEVPYSLPYAGVIVPTATLKHSLNSASLTLGFKF